MNLCCPRFAACRPPELKAVPGGGAAAALLLLWLVCAIGLLSGFGILAVLQYWLAAVLAPPGGEEMKRKRKRGPT